MKLDVPLPPAGRRAAPGGTTEQTNMKKRANPASQRSHMNVRVVRLYYHGRALFKDDPRLTEYFDGGLKIREDRVHKHGRVVLIAHLLGSEEGKEVIVHELNDVTLLQFSRRYMRIRGFEYVDDTEYAQTWQIEFL